MALAFGSKDYQSQITNLETLLSEKQTLVTKLQGDLQQASTELSTQKASTENDLKGQFKSGVESERKRFAAVMTSELYQGREGTALDLLTKTDAAEETILIALQNVPAKQIETTNYLDLLMKEEGNPDIDVDIGFYEDEQTPVTGIISAGKTVGVNFNQE